MNNERIDLEWLLEEDGLMHDLNWSIARFEQVEKLVKEMTAELKRCYEEIDSLQGKINKANYAMQRYCDEWPDLPYPDHRIDNVCDAYEEVCLALE